MNQILVVALSAWHELNARLIINANNTKDACTEREQQNECTRIHFLFLLIIDTITRVDLGWLASISIVHCGLSYQQRTDTFV